VILDMVLNESINRIAIVGRTESVGHVGANNCVVQNNWFPQCGGGGALNQRYCNGNGQNCAEAGDGFIGMFAMNMAWTWSTRFGDPADDHITSAAFSPAENYI